jgi:ech hydrogenase subunit B
MIVIILKSIVYLLCAPVFGGFLVGLDRKLTARLQGRVGPPLRQPFLDVGKLFQKEKIYVRRSQNVYIYFYLIFMIFTGALLFTGEDILLFIFSLTLASIFLVIAGYKGSSPYSWIGAERELIQIMAYEPAVLLSAVGMYEVTKSFFAGNIAAYPTPLIIYLPGIFLAFLFILTIKFRKSPFDLSTSHHAHQEIVKGVTTEFSGPALGMIEIAHWFELSAILGFVYLFFAALSWLAIPATLAVYFLLVLVDNTFARAKWQPMLFTSWAVALVFGSTNLIVLYLVLK